MKKTRVLSLLLCAAVVVLLAAGCNLLFPEPAPSPSPSADPSAPVSEAPASPSSDPEASASPGPDVVETPKVSMRELYRQDKILADDGTVLVEYEAALPLISDQTIGAAASINQYYRSEMDAFLSNAATELRDIALLNLESSRENDSSFIPCHASENYVVELATEEILSISREIDFYFGSVSVDQNLKSDTFDLLTGEHIVLDNLFAAGEDEYMARLSAEVTAQIEAAGGADAGYYDDYALQARDYLMKENFYLTETGVVVFYPAITVAPAMLGVCRFEIPYDNLSDLLAERLR